jgi:phage FluMu protein Com
MQIRCVNCHRPYALGKVEVHALLDQMETESLHYVNTYCPHCRRTNKISRDELMRAAPDWRAQKEQTEAE